MSPSGPVPAASPASPSRAFSSRLPGTRSLRWRLQVWHGIVLVVVLILFGLYVHHLQWETRVQHVDTELNRTADIIVSRLRRLFGPPRPGGGPGSGAPGAGTAVTSGSPAAAPGSGEKDRSRDREATRPEGANVASRVGEGTRADSDRERGDRGPGERSGAERNPGERTGGSGPRGPGRDRVAGPSPPAWPWRVPGSVAPEEFINSNDSQSPIYFLIWDREGRVLEKSADAPETAFPGLRTPSDGFPIRKSQIRDRGLRREVILVRWFDINVLVGRSMEQEILAHRRSGLVLIGAGSAIMLIGLVGGWWFTSRAIRPIQIMSDTAASISADNLNKRISLSETDSELGELATVLNQAFDRLHQAFDRQTQFTADASHELRTPVAVILAQTQMSLLKPRSPEDYRTSLQACQRAAKRMKKLIDALLQLARLDAPRTAVPFQPVELDNLLRDLVSLLETKAAETNISLELQAVPCRVLGDPDRLDQLMMNLLSNAIRYNREGGKVVVSMEQEPEHVVVTVKDSGLGIPAESIPFLFDRFYRVDPSRSNPEGGTGLGLSISKAIVDAHGGTIRIESTVGEGTSVIVRLPRLKEPARLETTEPDSERKVIEDLVPSRAK